MRLYKYLPPARLDVLTCRLRFTQAEEFNDPFEMLPNIEAMLPPEKLQDYLARFILVHVSPGPSCQ